MKISKKHNNSKRMTRRIKTKFGKFLVFLLLLLVVPMNSSAAFFDLLKKNSDMLARSDEINIDSVFQSEDQAQAADYKQPVTGIDDQSDEIISDDPGEEFKNPLDTELDEIVSETCEIDRAEGGKKIMRCSRSKRFAWLDGRWQDFDQLMSENYVDGQMNFSFRDKSFSLAPFIVKDRQKINIKSMGSATADQIDYQTEFDVQRRYTKWTNTFQGDSSIGRAGYTIETNLPVRFIEEKNEGAITHLSAVVDEYIEISFDDLLASGYSLERTDNTIYINGISGGKVELDPELFFYSTSAVDGDISYCDGTPLVYNVGTDGTSSTIGQTKAVVCQGGSSVDYQSYLSFDTSGLDDDVTISTANLYVYASGYSKHKDESSVYGVDYYIGTDQIGSALTSADWTFGSMNGSTYDWAETTGWKNKSISSPDSHISKTGDTDFNLRPNWTVGSNHYKYAYMRQTEYSGVTSDPYLEVVWGEYWGNEFLVESTSAIGNMDASNEKTGIKFTAQSGGTVNDFVLNVYQASSSPTYRWGIQSDNSGSPSGTWLQGSSTSSYVDSTGSAGWNTITFASTGRPTLTAGTVYHIVVQYASGTIGASNYISIRRSDPRNQMLPYRGAIDTASNTEFYGGMGWTAQNYQPIYMIDYFDAAYADEGNPYYGSTNATVYKSGSNYYSRGEKFTVYENSKEVDSVGMYVMKSGSCTPSGDLLYKIKNSSDTTLDSGTLVTAGSASTSWTWEDASLGSNVDLDAGEVYKIYVYTEASTACYYRLSNYYSNTSSQWYAIGYNSTDSRYGYCYNTTSNCDSDSNWAYYNYYDTPFRFNVVKIFSARSQNWRMYGDEDDATPGDDYAAENTSPPDNIGKKEPVKLRLTIADVGDLDEDNIKFGLKYSTSSTFSDGGYALGTTACLADAWCYFDGDNVSDDDSIASRVLSDSSTSGRHNESFIASSTFDFTASDEVEFEFTFWGNNPSANTAYYFAAYDNVSDQLVPINPSGDYSYPSLTTSSSFVLSVGAPNSKECDDYTIGGTGSNTCQLQESSDEEIQMWDDRGTGVGWSVTAVLEHLKAVTNGTPYSDEGAITMPKIQNQKVARTTDNILFMTYNDGTKVQFQKSSDGGATWTEAITGSPDTVGDGTSDVGLFMDSSENIHICYEDDDDIDYRLLTKSGTQWTIGSATEVVGSSGTRNYFDCSIAVESDGDINVAVAGEIFLTNTPVIDVYRDTGGGFSSSYGEQTSVDSPTVTVWNSDQVMHLWVTTTFAYSIYNGSSWSAPASIDTATPSNEYSVITDEDDVLHLVYEDSGIHYRYNDGSWSGETTLTSDSSDGYPTISSDGTSLYVFFHDDVSSDAYLSYLEYDGSSWDSTPVQLDDVLNSPKPYTPPQIARNQFWVVYEYFNGEGYDSESWYTHDMIRAEDVNWSTGTINALYGAEIGSCPSAGVCAGTSGAMDPEVSVTVADADACTGSGCPADPTFGMGKYYVEPTMTLSDLNFRRVGEYQGTLEITIS